jgi:amino acid adenylation domain-containing protein
MKRESMNLKYTAVDFDPFSGPEIEKIIPLIDPQQEIWLSSAMSKDASLAYNESLSIKLKGEVNFDLLKKAVKLCLNRHESLRAVFAANGQSMIIYKEALVNISVHDFSGTADVDDRLISFYEQDASTAFDLVNGPLVRTNIIRVSDDEVIFVITAHHIVCDGWSLGIMVQDISKLYSQLIEGSEINLAEAVSFETYARNQLAFKKSKEYEMTDEYWFNQYKSEVPQFHLPHDKKRPNIRSFNGKRIDIELDVDLGEKIKKTGTDQGSSFVNTMLAAFEILLYKVCRSHDLVVGLPSAGQSTSGNYHLVGHCVNLLPLKTKINPELGFNAYLQERKSYLLDAFDHPNYTFSNLLTRLKISRDKNRIPLVPVVFNIDMGIDDGVDFHELKHEVISNPRMFENFELFLNITGSSEKIVLEYSFNTDLFSEEAIRQLAEEFECLLEDIAKDPSQKIQSLNILSEQNREKLLYEWSGLKNTSAYTDTVTRAFEEIVSKHSSKTALIQGDDKLSYKELDSLSDRLANRLSELGVVKGDYIPICTDDGFHFIIAILGILKLGAAYVPIESAFPEERILFILNDIKAKNVLTGTSHKALFSGYDAELLFMDEPTVYSKNEKQPEVEIAGHDVAYIMYTSGSTGVPKGVIIPHKGICRLVCNTDFIQIDENDVLVQLSNQSFDTSTFDIYGSLLHGASLVLPEDRKNVIGNLSEIIDKNKINIMWLTAGLFNVVVDNHLDDLKGMKHVLAGGDVLSVAHVLKASEFLGPGKVINGYGPTENTTFSSAYSVNNLAEIDQSVPIGTPIRNSTVYILDENHDLLAPGVTGELYVGGDGLALGYLNREDLDKFIEHPFIEGEKLYQTGDLVRFNKNGILEFIGRKDAQLKIRGFRVEPGEIENCIAAFPGVMENAVLGYKDASGNNDLVAFIVCEKETEVSTEELKTYIKSKLPAYMCPGFIIQLEKMLLTDRGKIDKQALKKAVEEKKHTRHVVVEATSREEHYLLAQWKRLLDLEKLSITDNFFDLGGHSLIAVSMMAEIERDYKNKLPLSVLFEYPSIQELAKLLKAEKVDKGWQSLVSIQADGSRIPLYIVHGAGESIMLFNSLASLLGKDQPIYGLQAKGINGIDKPFDNFREMASYYIQQILEQNPSGPYAISGFSMGGIIAYEMAQQMRQMGKEVVFLGLFDTDSHVSAPYYLSKDAPGSERLWKKIKFRTNQVLFVSKLFLKEPLHTLKIKYYSFKYKGRNWMWEKQQEKLRDKKELSAGEINVERANIYALKNYDLQPYGGFIDLFKIKELDFYMVDFKDYGWSHYVEDRIRIHPISGKHVEIFSPPHNEEFASKLKARLDEINVAGSS